MIMSYVQLCKLLLLLYWPLWPMCFVATGQPGNETEWRPMPVERRGPLADNLKEVVGNLFVGSSVEVPKVKQMSQLLTQLFPKAVNTTTKYRMVTKPDNKRKVLSNFGYAFDESLEFVSKLKGNSDSKSSDSDQDMASSTIQTHYTIPEDGSALYINLHKDHTGKKKAKITLSKQLKDHLDTLTPAYPQVQVVYGSPKKGLYPTKPVFSGRSIKKSKPSKKTMTIKYSKVETEPEMHTIKSSLGDLYTNKKSHDNSTSGELATSQLDETPSQLMAVHYIDDLHNKTHQEFNKMSNIYNTYPAVNSTADMKIINSTIDFLTSDQNFTQLGSSPAKLLANSSENKITTYQKKDTPKKLKVSPTAEKLVFSPRFNENFTGLDWKPILGPIGSLRSSGESIVVNKYMDIATNTVEDSLSPPPIIRIQTKQKYKQTNQLPPILTGDVNYAEDLIPEPMYEVPRPKPYYPMHDSYRMLPSVVHSHYVAPDLRPEYSTIREINITPKPIVHRIKDLFKKFHHSIFPPMNYHDGSY